MLPMPKRDPRWRLGRLTFRPLIESPLSPFDSNAGCFVGDQWFVASKKAVEHLAEPSPFRSALMRHYRLRSVPDESFYQTMLLNQELVIDRDNRRFTDWNGGGAHPRILTEDDLPAMLSSGAFFARKFAHASPVLERLDEALA
jgi:hypothetical protein